MTLFDIDTFDPYVFEPLCPICCDTGVYETINHYVGSKQVDYTPIPCSCEAGRAIEDEMV